MEQYLHEIDQKLSTKNYEDYFRKHVTIDIEKSPQFTALIIDSNYSIRGHVIILNSCNEPVFQQFAKAALGASDVKVKAMIVLDICSIDNGFIDNEIINFAYMMQEELAIQEILLMDYILASPNMFVSLRSNGVI